MNTKLRHWRPLAVAMGIVITAPGLAGAKVDPLFASHETLSITLSGDMRSITRDRSEQPEDQPATLTFAHEGGLHTAEIGLRQRGKSRRDREVCTFPPLRLDLPKKDMEGTVFAKQDKLKLVTHCRSGRRGEQYLLREYLAYRIFNLLTEASFAVRMVSIDYVDTQRGGRTSTHPGFLIEHKDRLAKRLGMELVEVDRVQPDALAPAGTTLAELYQYLISNTDFSFIAGPENDICCHNAILLADSAGKLLPVPYDFDASGLIDAEYAMPQTALGQRNVRDRVFRGFCRPDPYLNDAVATAQSVRADVFALIDGLDGLEPRVAGRISQFIEEFYEVLDDERKYQREISGACRNSG